MDLRWAIALFAAALAAAAATAEPPKAEADELRFRNLLMSLGERQFAQSCAVCHGMDARGGGPAAGALRQPPPDLTRIAARRGGSFPDADIAAKIDGRFEVTAHGSREMPVWGVHLATPIAEDASGDDVARGRIELLVEYLKTLQVER